jgi:ankyrin repeat protein
MTFDEAHRLIKNGDLVSLRHELDAGTSANVVNQFSWTLLMLTAIEGNTTIGELLISRGATIDKTNDFGETALSLAAHAGHARFITVLLAHGASKHCRPHGHTLEDWMQVRWGLPRDKIKSILNLINSDQ